MKVIDGINRLLAAAENDGRNFLLEPEVYKLLKTAGLSTPRHIFIPAGSRANGPMLRSLGAGQAVVKVVSPLIVHKSDVGGVRVVKATPKDVNSAMEEMLRSVPRRYSAGMKNEKRSLKAAGPARQAEARRSIRGFLVVEKVEYGNAGFGSEIIFGIRNTRDFGPVLTAGSGGLDVEYMSERLRPGQATASASVHLLRPEDVLDLVRPLAFYGKLAEEFRGRKPLVKPEVLVGALALFRDLAEALSPFSGVSPYVIEEAEVNPFVVARGRLIPLDGLCRFSRNKKSLPVRPVEGVDKLLKPSSIGIIGVSEKMNIGRIILRNILAGGFPAGRVFVVKPGIREIEGCGCVPSVKELPSAVDLFVLTLAADQSIEVMRELVENEKARSVILISGGMGEKSGGASIEGRLRDLLEKGRRQGKLTPVVNGGNCLGIISRPGAYDTTFIPEQKLPKPEGDECGLAFVSQSGAFMICRMNKMPEINPRYAVSLGNQLDLTVSDYVRYLKQEKEVKTTAVYLEGFKPEDGYRFAVAVRDMTLGNGRPVLVYKAGRSAEGRAATSSHTASVAGDYRVFRDILMRAGAIVTQDLFEFESFMKGLVALEGRRIRGRRAGLISNAGFECVVLADNLKDSPGLELATFSRRTEKRILEALKPLGIDRLQDVHNPLDVTPVADDKAFSDCSRAIVEAPEVDCAVISNVPMTPAQQTLAPGPGHEEDLARPGSFASRTIEIFKSTDKPVVVNIDAGDLYTPLARHLESHGLPVFRRADQAVSFLRELVNHALSRRAGR